MTSQQLYQPRTLLDWMQRSQGPFGADMRYGYFGPGSGMIRKDITTAGDTFVGSDFFTNTYGRKVWDSLNSMTRAFNLMRKVAWGPTTGYRIRSGRNRSTQPVGEIAALPTIDSPTLETVFVQPAFTVTALGVSALAQFLGTLEGGIGDALAVAQETAMIDHTKRMNEMLMANPDSRIVTGAADGAPSVVINAAWFSVGDVFREAGQATDLTVVATDVDAGTVTFAGGATTTDRILYVRSRAQPWGLFDALDVTGLNRNGTAFTAAEAAGYGSLAIANRDPLTWSGANVFASGDGTLRHLTTGLLDKGIDQVRIGGGEPDLLLTGIEQVTRLGTILQANQHFIGEGDFQVKQGGEGTLIGFPTGFQVATYKGIPLFHDYDAPRSYQQAANGDAVRGAHVAVLDTRFIEIPVLFTTQYLESRDYIQNNMLGIKALFLTGNSLRVLDFRKQAKIVDLSDGVLTV